MEKLIINYFMQYKISATGHSQSILVENTISIYRSSDAITSESVSLYETMGIFNRMCRAFKSVNALQAAISGVSIPGPP